MTREELQNEFMLMSDPETDPVYYNEALRRVWDHDEEQRAEIAQLHTELSAEKALHVATQHCLSAQTDSVRGCAKKVAELNVKIEQLQAQLATAKQEVLQQVRAQLVKNPLIKTFLEGKFWDANYVDLVFRYNGQDKRYEADWIKRLWYLCLEQEEKV